MVNWIKRFWARGGYIYVGFTITALLAWSVVPWFLYHTIDPTQPQLTIAEIFAGKDRRPENAAPRD